MKFLPPNADTGYGENNGKNYRGDDSKNQGRLSSHATSISVDAEREWNFSTTGKLFIKGSITKQRRWWSDKFWWPIQ